MLPCPWASISPCPFQWSLLTSTEVSIQQDIRILLYIVGTFQCLFVTLDYKALQDTNFYHLSSLIWHSPLRQSSSHMDFRHARGHARLRGMSFIVLFPSGQEYDLRIIPPKVVSFNYYLPLLLIHFLHSANPNYIHLSKYKYMCVCVGVCNFKSSLSPLLAFEAHKDRDLVQSLNKQLAFVFQHKEVDAHHIVFE